MEIGVQLAEESFRGNNCTVARKLVEEYFQLDPQKNQYFCRAKLLLGLIIHAEAKELNGPLSIQRRKEAVDEIMHALDIATSQVNLSRYQFLVYNCSIAFWNVSRGFLRKGRARNFASAFEKISSALEQQDDKDKEWRIQMLAAAAFCFHDDNNIKAASDFVDKAINLMDSLLSNTHGEEKKVESLLLLCKQKVDDLMAAFREIEEREELLRKPRKIDPDLPFDDDYYTRPIEYPPLQGLAGEGKEKVKRLLDLSQSDKSKLDIKMRQITDLKKIQTEALIRYHRQRIAVNIADGKRYMALPNISKDLRTSSLVQIQCILSNVIVDKEVEVVLSAIIKKLEESQLSENRSETLLDVSRVCWMLGFNALALKCMDFVTAAATPITRILRIKLDICEAQSIVKQIEATTLEKASLNSLSVKQIEGIKISKRLEAIKVLERTLVMSVPLVDDKFLIQEMCIIMWNTMVPLLTNKLRLKVHSALKSMTTSLEAVECDFLAVLRSQVHYELALCEDASDYAGLALAEIERSYEQDYGEVNIADTRPFHDKESFDLNRVRDQYLHPLKIALNLRVDVYSTPSLLDDQMILWLQQAKESSSKSFVKDMILKVGVLLFREMESDSFGLQSGAQGNVDWSVEIMKVGDLKIHPVSLVEIEKIIQTPPHNVSFTFSLNKRLKNLMTLAELAYSIQDTNSVQRACLYVLSFKWEASTSFGPILLEWQIKCCCFLAESFAFRIQVECSTVESAMKSKGRRSITKNDIDSKNLSLGVNDTNVPPEILSMKRLAVNAIKKGFTLSMELKDIFLVQNVLIYFWNLHLHIVRKKLFSAVLDEIVDFLKLVTTSTDSLVAYGNSADFLDPKLILFYYEVLSCISFAKGSVSDALSLCTKALQISFSSIPLSSTANAYARKAVIEVGSVYNVLHAIQSSATNAKGKEVVVPGPLSQTENPFLSVFGALSIAEADTASIPGIPPDLQLECLEKASKIMLADVPTMVQKEVLQEDSKQVIKTKEARNQRLEMMLECCARLSRLKILRGDYVGAQDWSEVGLKQFYSTALVLSNTSRENMEKEGDDDGNSKIYRWISNCEQCMALAISSFLDASNPAKSKASSVQATLDPELVTKLQFVALEHLNPSVRFAVLADEESLMVKSGSLASILLQDLLATDDYQALSFELALSIVAEMAKLRQSRYCQVVLQNIYLSMITSLVLRKEYDRCLKLIITAFEVIDHDLQKDLWPARVICMSRKGMNVLDGLQKLKEKDPLLQARVLVLFARSTKDLTTKFSVYLQAIELLDGYAEKVEYLLELSETMSITGMPRSEIKIVLRLAISCISALEEKEYDDIKDWDEDDLFGKESALSRARSVATSRTKLTGAKTATTDSKRRAGSPSGKTTGNPSTRSNDQSKTEVDFRTLEQAARAYSMLIRVESNFQQKLQYASKAVYYVKRCFELWIETIRHWYKMSQFSKLDNETKIEFLEFNCVYPSYLAIPVESFAVWHWTNSLDLRNMTWELLQEFPNKLPSLQALPSFASTVVNLFFLIEQLYEYQIHDCATYVVAFTKLILWTTPSKIEIKPEQTPSDRKVPLLALQCITMKLFTRLGCNIIDTFRGVSYILDNESNPCPVGKFLNSFIEEANRINFSHDMNRDQIYDLAFQDMIKHLHQLSNNVEQPFEIETTACFFDSLIRLDESFYWVKACEELIGLGLYDKIEQVLLCLLWESRKKHDARKFADITGLLLKLQYSKGDYEQSIILALRQRDLLQYIGDTHLFETHFMVALRSYYALDLIEEGKQLYMVVMKLIEDLALRKIEKPLIAGGLKSTRPNSVMNEIKVQTTLNTSQSKVTVTSQSSRTSKGEKRFSVSEFGWEYIQTWKSISLLFIELTSKELLDRVQAWNEPKDGACSNKDDVIAIFKVLDEVFGKALSVVKEVTGEDNLWELQINIIRARKACEFFRILSGAYVRNNIEKYDNLSDSEARLTEVYHFEGVRIARTWMESFTQFSHKVANTISDLPATIFEVLPEHSFVINPVDIVAAPSDIKVRGDEITINRLYGLALFEAGWTGFLKIIQTGSYKSPTIFHKLSLQKPNVVDQYLDTTYCPTELNLDDLAVPSTIQLYNDMTLASNCLQNTKYEMFAQLLSVAALVATFNRSQNFDANWIPVSKNELLGALKYPYVEATYTAWQSVLLNKIETLVDSDTSHFESIVAGSIAVAIESFGCNSVQNTSKCVIWLQSLKAKWWLRKQWSTALDQKSQQFRSLQKMDLYYNSEFPSADSSKLFFQEKEYLNSISVAFRR